MFLTCYTFNAHIPSHFAELSRCIVISECDDEEYTLKNNFPEFLFLCRDLDLIASDEKGKEISLTDYILKEVLVTTNSGNKPLSARDRVVEAILKMFPKVECQHLPHPGLVITNPTKPMDPDFFAHLNTCIQYILSNIKWKKSFFSSVPLNGPMLALLLEQYVHAINLPGGIPNLKASPIKSTLHYKIFELQRAYRLQMKKHVQKKFPMEEGDIKLLESSHSYLMDEALAGKLEAANYILEEQTNLFEVHLAVYSDLLKSLTSEVHRWIPILGVK